MVGGCKVSLTTQGNIEKDTGCFENQQLLPDQAMGLFVMASLQMSS